MSIENKIENSAGNNPESDMHVISKMSGKDRNAAQELITEYFELNKNKFKNYAIRCLKNIFYLWEFSAQDAQNLSMLEVDDLLQKVIMSLITSPGNLRISNEDDLKAYINKSIIRRANRMAASRAKFERTHIPISRTNSMAEAREWEDIGLLSPTDIINNYEDEMTIKTALDLAKKETSLEGKFLHVLRMYLLGYSYEEIAKTDSVSAGAIRIAMFRFRKNSRSQSIL